MLFSGCYTIIDPPIADNYSDTSEDYIASTENFSDEYIIINNYECSHENGCCGHDLCHSFSDCHGYFSNGAHCHLSYNWWTGTYTCASYYCNGYNSYGYYDGYYHGYWWGYNNWWWNTGGSGNNNYTQDEQERRDRSFSRTDTEEDSGEGDYTLFGITYQDNNKSVTPINNKKNIDTPSSRIDDSNKLYKRKGKKKSGLIGLLFKSKRSSYSSKSNNTKKSSSSSYKSDKSGKSDKSSSKKSNNKSRKKQTEGRRR